MADISEESRNLAIEAYRAAYVANSSNSTLNSNSNPSKKAISVKRVDKRKDFKGKGLKTSSNKVKYKDNKPRRRPRDPALYNSWLYNTGSTDHISNSKEQFTTFTPNIGQLHPINTGNSPVSLAGIGSITLEVLSRKAPPTYTKLVLNNVLYLPNIDINIVSRVRHYDSGGCLIKETLYRGNRHYIAILDFKKSGFFLNVKGSSKPILHANFAFPLGLSSYTTKSIELQCNKIVVEIPSNSIRKEDYRPIIEDAIVSEALEPKKRYKLRNSPAKGTTLEGIGPSLRGKRPRRPIEPLATAQAPYQSPCKTREPKPLTGTRDLPYMLRGPVIEGNKVVEKAISSPTLKEPNIEGQCLKTSTIKFIEDNTVLSQPTNNTALEGELVDLDLDLEGAVSPDPSNLNTEKPIGIEIGPSKLEPYESSSDNKLDKPSLDKPINPVIVESTRPTISIIKPELPDAFPQTIQPIFLPKPIELVARGFIQVEGLDYTVTYASTSILPTWHILLAIGAVLDWEIEQATFIGAFLDSAFREEIYMEIPKELLDLAASNKAICKLLLKYSYNPSTANIIKLSKALYSLKQSPREWQDKLKILLESLDYLPFILDPGVFYNAKTCHFIVTFMNNCLFIGPDIGYITDLKKPLNKLSRSLNRPTKSHLNTAKNLFKYLNNTKDYSICFSYNGNTVPNLGPKLSNSSNITTKLSRDCHFKEGPRALTTTTTTIVDSRNGKGSSRTSIINNSLVPIGFSNSDFTGDKATSKPTYSYIYKLAEAIREVQWIIGLFSELYRPIDHPITLYGDN
ncbi:hypothetical protein P8C59_003229 [Phyllachora maydis]|uniref:Reverse transcriptase Ty1/copia-type domain-containing protein n=1 Tax=Phyllachora maydis TaxID=1825666 RepID=A0AAD9MA51_9PEZI|nr:hypothetical protein P8C59_003229 [Phyllachora maydis]